MRTSIVGTLILCWTVTGCSESSVSTALPATPFTTRPVEVFINNHAFGPSHGCTSTPTARDGSVTDVTISLTCGPVGAVSKVTWKLLRADERGDRYLVERTFPYGEIHAQTEQREVVFEGSEVIVFEDDRQRVVMRPLSKRD